MAEKTMKEAVDPENYARWDKGLGTKKEPAPVIPEPQPPKVAELLTLDKIKLDQVAAVPKGIHRVVRNQDGVMFTGFDIIIQMKERPGKDGQVIPGERLSGWMPSKDFHEMRRILFRGGKVAMTNVEF